MSNINYCVKCSISNCKHFDESNYCKLTTISVGGNNSCVDCKDTECKSFEINS
ncbi:DUF1540 domain-containing protein [[Clostridium] colinum]|uniref:DUF1540 domain-containing protein n=1 Tax=[Clostridium] colinum TaxID=36835 RepID=UPI00202582CF|nr:DUF1540 domain-containing protein [[Clostridium] colinum]